MEEIKIHKNEDYSHDFIGAIECSDKLYHSDPAINNSGLKVILDNSPHYFKEFGTGSNESSALSEGSLVHAMLLDKPEKGLIDMCPNRALMDEDNPEEIDESEFFRIAHGGRTSKKFKEQSELEKKGRDRHVVSLTEWQNSVNISRGALAYNSKVKDMLARSEYQELAAFTQVNGHRARAKADAISISEGIIWDIKTSRDSLDSFKWSAKKYKYHMQAAWYKKILSLVFGIDFDFRIIAIEKKPGYRVGEFEFSNVAMQEGEEMLEEAFCSYSVAEMTDYWAKPKDEFIIDWT